MRSIHSVFLVGLMGAGKTTIGRLLARELDAEFKDSDREVEQRSGADIPWIFDVEGEQGFRLREEKVISEVSNETGIVLATGGGAILSRENRQALQARGFVVYLKTSVEELFRRTSRDRNRPLLQVSDPKKTLLALVKQREPLYQEVADLVVRTDRQSPKAVVQSIIEQVKKL